MKMIIDTYLDIIPDVKTVLTIKDVSDVYRSRSNELFLCDKSKDHVFTGDQVVLKEYNSNANFIGLMLKLVTSNGKFIGCANTFELDKSTTYYTMHCPVCGEVHLFGFDRAN